MDSDRWKHVDDVLQSALDRAPEERDAFLRVACAGDPAMEREVRSLLTSEDRAGSFLQNPAMEVAARDLARREKEVSSPLARSGLLEPGQCLGPYRIECFLAAGGMGEVYRATDTRLHREVALKVSAARFTDRFEKEARVVASLNHPNICQLYDVGPNFLVMELVEGPTLDDRIRQGALATVEALAIARQIADALEAAHEKGIVHRDLKPANVKITPENVVKVLDFGLAKTAEQSSAGADPAQSPTLTISPTRAGMILGTAAYMSPEQVRGGAVDKRSDIWAFGAVLYEMLAGKRLFAGESVSDILAAVLRAEPDWGALPAATPSSIVKLVRRCLTKDRKQRLQAIGEARIALESPALEEAVPVSAPLRGASVASTWARLGWGLAAALLVGLGVVSFMHFREKGPPRPIVTRFTFPLPEGTVPVPGGIAVSSDGSRLAFAGGLKGQIYVRSMDQFEAMPITGTEGASFLSFSPDGEWISYDVQAAYQLKKVAVAGGPSQVLVEAGTVTGSPSPPVQNWGSDENILFSHGALFRIPSAGGKPQTLATPDANAGEAWYTGPQLLPGGRQALFTMLTKNGMALAALNLQTGEKKVFLENRSSIGQFAQTGLSPTTGHLLYYDSSNGSVMAVAFDANRLQVRGSPVSVLPGVQGARGPFGSFGFSDSGTLAYIAGNPTGFANRTLVWVDRKGAEQPLAAPPHPYTGPAVSPDGEWIAVEVDEGSQVNIQTDIWIYGLARGTLNRLTSDNGSGMPLWTPDAKRLIYSFQIGSPGAPKYEVRSAVADGSSPPTTVSAPSGVYISRSISPDGKLIIGARFRSLQRTELGLLSIQGTPSADARPQSFLDSQFKFKKVFPQFSPVDGRWVAYQSDETGRSEIYVAPYPGPGRKWPISNQGGTEPRWARNGRELFYRNGDKMMAVDVETGPDFEVSAPKVLFEGHYSPPANFAASYDVAPDGKRFLMLKPATGQTVHFDQLHVVVNWYEELRRRVPRM